MYFLCQKSSEGEQSEISERKKEKTAKKSVKSSTSGFISEIFIKYQMYSNFHKYATSLDIKLLRNYDFCVLLIKHPKNWETALWGKERLYGKKGLTKERLY